jgi:hypothetical protein
MDVQTRSMQRTRTPEEERDAILDATIVCHIERVYEGATIDAIGELCGLTPDVILAALLDRWSEWLSAWLLSA